MAEFIRVLWGEHTRAADRVWTSVHARRNETIKPHVYVYGVDNANRIVRAGYSKVTLIHPDPYPDGRREELISKILRRSGGFFVTIKGPWHYKFQLIKRAIEDHGEVVYCDWDVNCHAKDFPYVMSKLEGRLATFSLMKYISIRHPERLDHRSRCLGVAGRWLHFNGTEFVDRVLAKMTWDGSRLYHDEFAMGDIMDEDAGGWMGEVEWLKRYESTVHLLSGRWFPWMPVKYDDRGAKIRRPIRFKWERLFR